MHVPPELDVIGNFCKLHITVDAMRSQEQNQAPENALGFLFLKKSQKEPERTKKNFDSTRSIATRVYEGQIRVVHDC